MNGEHNIMTKWINDEPGRCVLALSYHAAKDSLWTPNPQTSTSPSELTSILSFQQVRPIRKENRDPRQRPTFLSRSFSRQEKRLISLCNSCCTGMSRSNNHVWKHITFIIDQEACMPMVAAEGEQKGEEREDIRAPRKRHHISRPGNAQWRRGAHLAPARHLRG